MYVTNDQRPKGGAAGRAAEIPTFTLLSAAMASGLCLELMLERLMDRAAEGLA